MSIIDKIRTLEGDGKLYRFTPKSRRPCLRRLYLTEDAHKEYTDPNSAVNMLVGNGFINSAFTRWTLGDLVYAKRPGKTGGFLKELDPPPSDIWELRITEPVVQARLFGTFAEPDTLVLTHLHTRRLLGKKGSSTWLSTMRASAQAWLALFDHPPFRANRIQDYVTENCDDFPLER